VSRLRTAVIGCGHLGRIHAQLLAGLEEVELVAVVDPQAASREAVAAACGARALADYHRLLGHLDAAVVAAPTSLHHAITRRLLEEGVHVLVEKPLTPQHDTCEQLVQLARARRRVLAVGHVERFNPAFVAAAQQVARPLYIEATRTGGFSFRSMDVGVVLDLMIHDLELILAMVDASVASVSAVGAPVVTPHEDFAEARIVFTNGCVAELKASRTSPVAQRQMTIYGSDRHVYCDLGQRSVRVLERNSDLQQGTLRVDRLTATEIEALKPAVFQTLLPMREVPLPEANPLRDELRDFVRSVQHGHRPRVDGGHAARAVWLADQIVSQIRSAAARPASLDRRRAA
jgi:predicted dehydrogenase